MTGQSRFYFSAYEGVLELEGSEQFVAQQVEALRELIGTLAARGPCLEDGAPVQPFVPDEELAVVTLSASSPDVQPVSVPAAAGVSPYPHTFEELGGVLKIVADIPGENTRAKMRNAGLLYCFGNELLGRSIIPCGDVRLVCQDHGCLDGANFSKAFNDRKLFVLDGVRGGSKSTKLTHLGRKQAKQMVEAIESNGA